jgi:hypothetical protein
MWAILLPVLLPIAESAGAALLGYLIAHFGPSLGIDPAQAAMLAAAAAKLAPSNVTAKLVPVAGMPPPDTKATIITESTNVPTPPKA